MLLFWYVQVWKKKKNKNLRPNTNYDLKNSQHSWGWGHNLKKKCFNELKDWTTDKAIAKIWKDQQTNNSTGNQNLGY